MAVCDSPPVLLDRPLQQRRKEKETRTPAGHEEPGGGAPRLGELFLHGDDPAGVDGGEGDWQEEPVGEVERDQRGRCSCTTQHWLLLVGNRKFKPEKTWARQAMMPALIKTARQPEEKSCFLWQKIFRDGKTDQTCQVRQPQVVRTSGRPSCTNFQPAGILQEITRVAKLNMFHE